MKRLLSLILISGLIIGFAACSSSDDSPAAGDNTPVWVGTWLSAGDNVATLLSTYFFYDSVRVTITEAGAVTTETHTIGVGWASTTGVYTVTESATGNIDVVNFVYPAYEQEGIMQITEGSPDVMMLEVVQTVPDIQAVPPTVAAGFGSTNGGAYLDWNVQTYVRISE